jgi:hypothetical protein
MKNRTFSTFNNVFRDASVENREKSIKFSIFLVQIITHYACKIDYYFYYHHPCSGSEWKVKLFFSSLSFNHPTSFYLKRLNFTFNFTVSISSCETGFRSPPHYNGMLFFFNLIGARRFRGGNQLTILQLKHDALVTRVENC